MAARGVWAHLQVFCPKSEYNREEVQGLEKPALGLDSLRRSYICTWLAVVMHNGEREGVPYSVFHEVEGSSASLECSAFLTEVPGVTCPCTTVQQMHLEGCLLNACGLALSVPDLVIMLCCHNSSGFVILNWQNDT